MAATDSPWDALSAEMDAAVDDALADRVEYAVNGVDFLLQPAFVEIIAPGEDALTAFDEPLGTRKRVKIRKDLVPLPTRAHRLKHPKLGAGTFQPSSKHPDEQGRYWIFDVQQA